MPGEARSQVLLEFPAGAGGQSGVFYSPANHVTLVKSAYFYNQAAADSTDVLLSVYDPEVGIIVRIFTGIVPAGKAVEWQGWAVLNPGQGVYMNVPADVSAWVSGAVLSGPAQFPPTIGSLTKPADAAVPPPSM